MTSKNLGLFAIMTAIIGDTSLHYQDRQQKSSLKPEDIDVTPKEKLIPKGCERYYYNDQGLCRKSESDVYFDALKPSIADKKYQRYLNK